MSDSADRSISRGREYVRTRSCRCIHRSDYLASFSNRQAAEVRVTSARPRRRVKPVLKTAQTIFRRLEEENPFQQ